MVSSIHDQTVDKRKQVEEKLKEAEKVSFLRLIFTDVLGKTKCVEVPRSQFKKALDGQIAFDGSSIDGFVRIEESDMYLKPDFDTFTINGPCGQLICDVYRPTSDFKTHIPFEGCPRLVLKKVEEEALKLGFKMNVGPEPEFFLLDRQEDGSFVTHDEGGYFDLSPKDSAFDFRNDVVEKLQSMGFEVEAAHHEVAPGQHEIDFKYDAATTTADKLTYFKSIVKEMALSFGLHATFMPKPISGVNGSGMHCHQSLTKMVSEDQWENAFYDASTENGLSEIARWYIGGILKHAKALSFITNPLVNSYKRLVPGFEAPTNICWSDTNRSLLVRVPASRDAGTRIELRMPDPACNPYLAFAAMLAAGLDGIKHQIEPADPIRRNMFTMSDQEKANLNVDVLPGTLQEAMNEFLKDSVITDALGEHVVEKLVEAKTAEWQNYIQQVHKWEVENYLDEY